MCWCCKFFQVADFGIFLGNLVLEVFALGGVCLLGLGLGLEVIQKAIGGIAEALDRIFGVLEGGVAFAGVVLVGAEGLNLLGNSNSGSGTYGKTSNKTRGFHIKLLGKTFPIISFLKIEKSSKK